MGFKVDATLWCNISNGDDVNEDITALSSSLKLFTRACASVCIYVYVLYIYIQKCVHTYMPIYTVYTCTHTHIYI